MRKNSSQAGLEEGYLGIAPIKAVNVFVIQTYVRRSYHVVITLFSPSEAGTSHKGFYRKYTIRSYASLVT